MSLQSLRQLRLSGSRPRSVLVVVGTCPLPDDGPGMVVVTRMDDDLRPLIKTPVFVLITDAATTLATHVIDRLLAMNAPILGASCKAGEVGITEEHAEFARTYRRWLCEMA